MHSHELNDCMHALREERITQHNFIKIIRPKLTFVARDLWNGWRRKLPAFVELQDIEQELSMQILAFIPKWNPAKKCTIESFVMWSAKHRTQREIHKWRGATIHGNEGKNPSRAEKSFSQLFHDDPHASKIDSILTRTKSTEIPEDRIDRNTQFDRALQRAKTIRETCGLRALQASDGSIAKASQLLLEDFTARIECGVWTRGQADRVIKRAIKLLKRAA